MEAYVEPVGVGERPLESARHRLGPVGTRVRGIRFLKLLTEEADSMWAERA